MWQDVPQQAVMAKFIAGKDAVCIAAIGATLHDGTKWGWVGDWGKICGLDWYYSGVTVRDGSQCNYATQYQQS